MQLFEDPPIGSKSPFQNFRKINSEGNKTNSMPLKLPQKSNEKKKTSSTKEIRRKFQVSNGYLFEFDQLARILHFMLENRDAKRISRQSLLENTGFANRQIESLVSIGAAIGLIKPGSQILTHTGLLIAKHDIFLENRSTLEWCHYIGAGSIRNLIWFEIFNKFLNSSSSMTQNELNEALRHALAGQYTKRTIGKHLYEEVRFVIDAYLDRNFKKLDILHQTSDSRLYRQRYTNFNPLFFAAMIYDFCNVNKAHLFEIKELLDVPGSPAMVFGLDGPLLRQQVEELHNQGWLRYESTHNLDQIRLKSGFSAIEFIKAYFENRKPQEKSDKTIRE